MEPTGALGAVAGQVYAVRVQKLAQDQQRADGDAAVGLIAAAAKPPPPPGAEGQGARINTYG